MNETWQVIFRREETSIVDVSVSAESGKDAVLHALIREECVDAVHAGANVCWVRRSLLRTPSLDRRNYVWEDRAALLARLRIEDKSYLCIEEGMIETLSRSVERGVMLWLTLMRMSYPDWGDIDQIYGSPTCGPRTYLRLLNLARAVDKRCHPAIEPGEDFMKDFSHSHSCREGVISTETTAVFYPWEVAQLQERGLHPRDLVLTGQELCDKMRIPEISNG